jgi:hypothetical protein
LYGRRPARKRKIQAIYHDWSLYSSHVIFVLASRNAVVIFLVLHNLKPGVLSSRDRELSAFLVE